MESPVRICLGAALVVNLLLLSSIAVNGNVIPHESNTTTPRGDRLPIRGRVKAPDVSLNELNSKLKPKVSTSEENAKYKDRGRGNIKFHTLLKSNTEGSIRRVRSTEGPKLLIVTPTPEVKKPTEIVESMHAYKTKLPNITTSSVTPTAAKDDELSEEEYEDDDEDNEESSEKFTSNFDNFFSIPSFGDFTHDSDFDSSNKKIKHDFGPPYGGFSSMFPHKTSYGFSEPTHDSFKAEFFNQNHETELTTPKNDFFDKRFSRVSSSILKNLDILKAKTAPNVTNVQNFIEKNLELQSLGNSSKPGNKTVFIKNTKEIRVLDNDGASSANKALSDVHGTSIYYEMSVLSTETYAINNSDYDCDNESLTSDPTPSTSVEEEQASIKAAQPALPVATRPALPDPNPEILSTVSSSFVPLSSIQPIYNTNPIAVSTQNTVSSTDKSKHLPNSFIRNRSYSKRLNLNRNKDSPNSVTSKPLITSSTSSPRQQTRKFHHTTAKTKPVWLVPRRNITRVRPTISSPIYSEHFSLKTTSRPRLSNQFFNRPAKTTLTTVSSDIDPILQGDIGGEKKVVQTQSIVDNSVTSLSKRGSMKFSASTASSTELDTESEMPPTAWALASLLMLPASPETVMNITHSAQKSVDENELQSVGEIIDKKATTTTSTTTTSANPISNDIISKKTAELDLNKVPWQPITESPKAKTQIEAKSEPPTTTNLIEEYAEESNNTQEPLHTDTRTDAPWIPVIQEDETTDDSDYIETETISTAEATNATGFESIKLVVGITTPQDENVASSELNQSVTENKLKSKTSEYEITTIRFSYVPSEESTTAEAEIETTETIVPSTWHPAFPTRTRITTIQDSSVTTYRPKYISTETEDENTTVFVDTTSPIEVSSQVLESTTKLVIDTTETPITTTEAQTDAPTTVKVTTEVMTEEITTEPSTEEITTQNVSTKPTTIIATQANNNTEIPTTTMNSDTVEDTTTIVVEVVTEINTERERRLTSTTTLPTTTEEMTSSEEDDYEDNSGSNEVITQDAIKSTTTEVNSPKYVTTISVKPELTTEILKTEPPTTTELIKETISNTNAKIHDTTEADTTTETEYTTKTVNEPEDVTSYTGELTTEHAPVKMDNEEVAESGAGVAIAVSTIGVIALILLIGLLLIVRRRGRRGVYAQRCTPVSLDAYSLDSVSVGHRKGNHRLRASKRSYGNPAYDDEVTSHPMQYAALANFALDVESMTAEFSEIPSVTVRPDEVPPGCEDKNRYSNVLPLPETRVPLKRVGNDPTTEYINANYITGPGNIRNYYIACQAPLSNTVVDFWRMIWEQNSRLIVMLTEYMENGVEKCFEYLPPSEISDNKRTFGDFKIILKKREQRDKYAVSSVQLINLGTRTWREVTHLWYFWPAKGVPEDYDSVIDFLCEMRSFMKVSQTAKEYDEEGVEVIYGDQNRSSFSNLTKLKSDEENSGNGVNVYSPARAEEQLRRVPPSNGTLGRMKAASDVEGIRPCVVTCASGSGRTAALVALDICTRALPGAADVPRVVRHLRAQRPHSLSNRHHYIFVYKVLSEYGNKMLGGSVDTI